MGDEMIYIFIAVFLFSTIEVIAKLIGNGIDPLLLAFFRFFISGIIFILFDYKKVLKIRKKDLKDFSILGFIGITIGIGAFHLGLNYINASLAAVIFSLNPIFSAFSAKFILGEEFGRKKIVGSLLAFIGSYIVIFGFKKVELNSLLGPLLLLLSSISFGIYITMSKKSILKFGNNTTTGMAFLLGSILYLPFIKNYSIETSKMPYILMLVFFCTTIAYFLYFKGLKSIPVSIGSAIFYLKPIFATVLAIIFLNEHLTINFVLGLGVIAIGLVTINKKEKKGELREELI